MSETHPLRQSLWLTGRGNGGTMTLEDEVFRPDTPLVPASLAAGRESYDAESPAAHIFTWTTTPQRARHREDSS